MDGSPFYSFQIHTEEGGGKYDQKCFDAVQSLHLRVRNASFLLPANVSSQDTQVQPLIRVRTLTYDLKASQSW